ncbi:MAG: hypothetical protein HYU27_00960 [Acidobacteria bacterium]|nr:hypothetical protein [Acidobacteriota bacterium]
MSQGIVCGKTAFVFAATAAVLLSGPAAIHAQRGRGAQPASTAKAGAPADLTGYWVSVISEDWKFRMVTPPKGQYGNVPLSPEGRKVADSWDPARDETAGEQCRAYGAAGVMRIPGRLHITWESDNVLRIDADAGAQTRLLNFGSAAPPGGPPAWQGHSAAQWQGGGARGGGAPSVAGIGNAGFARGGSLKVVTTRMRPGYLRKNGVPYGASAMMTEHFEVHAAPNGDRWLVVTAIIEDTQYLNSPYVTSTNFKRLPGASGFQPTPCSAK